MVGQNFGQMRNRICAELLSNEKIIRALVLDSADFMTAEPNDEKKQYIDSPIRLMRQYVYPFKRNFDTTVEKRPMITIEFVDFYKQGRNYRNGIVTFYILVPVDLASTNVGLRYDFIGDELEEIFHNTNIGEFSFHSRGDLNIGDRYIGHYVSFEITEFHIFDSGINTDGSKGATPYSDDEIEKYIKVQVDKRIHSVLNLPAEMKEDNIYMLREDLP